MEIVQRGAEAVLYRDKGVLIKERVRKGYRLKEIDEKLRKTRTRRESTLLKSAPVNVPKVFLVDDKEMKIEMEFIDGKLLKDELDNFSKEKRIKLCENIGENIGKLHDANIIHGDLTTSNMILKDKKVYFIDFGLGFVSTKDEDKAVDLHLFHQALQAKHYKHFEESFKAVLKGYKKSKGAKEVIKKLEQVESRGRYKRK